MLRRLAFTCALTGSACGPAPSNSAPAPESEDGSPTNAELSTAAEASTTTVDGEGETTEDAPCEHEDECPPDMLCVQGACQPDCGEARIQLEAPPPKLLWIVDQSASMKLARDHDANPLTPDRERWRDAYELVIQASQAYAESYEQALILYPSVDACKGAPSCFDASACEVPTELAVELDSTTPYSTFASTLESQYAQGPKHAASPLSGALQLAESTLTSLDGSDAYVHGIVLVTDGGSNCGPASCNGQGDCPLLEAFDSQSTERVAAILQQHHVPTYVVGVDARTQAVDTLSGDSPSGSRIEHLNALAAAGGLPLDSGDDAFFHADDADALIERLEIEACIPACDIYLQGFPNQLPAPDQLDRVSVYLGSEEAFLPQLHGLDEQPCLDSDQRGWIWFPPGEAVLLCGSACEEFSDGGILRAVYGCPEGE